MKKLASVLLSALMAASLVACGTATDAGTPAEDIDTILEVGDKCNDVQVVGSIEELAEKGDAAVLSETLGGVETTYYAVSVTSWIFGTVGGLDVDVNMNGLREDGSPIVNLYTVRQDSAAFLPEMHNIAILPDGFCTTLFQEVLPDSFPFPDGSVPLRHIPAPADVSDKSSSRAP